MIALYDRVAAGLAARSADVLPVLARLVFAAVLCGYFWSSALTKLGPDLLTPSLGAYSQIFPRAMEAVGYDASQLALWHRIVVLGGTAAEFVLPFMLMIGLLARLAALGMIGFVLVQSLTDVLGHGASGDTLGRWFDRFPDALIADQRALWLVPLLVIVMLGAGPISVDRVLRRVRRN